MQANAGVSPYWKQLFGIDLRTLALFRVMLAITCLWQLWDLYPDMVAIFDDKSGVFPREDAFLWQSTTSWSLYYLNGRVEWAAILFAFSAIASLALLVGYRTRIAIVAYWALVYSLTVRMPIFTSGAHMMLPILSFWAMFVPLGARFSVDAALSKKPKSDNAYASAGTLALLVQMACLYLFSALLKDHPWWHTTGESIYRVLQSTDLRSWLGAELGRYETLDRWLTFFVYYLELSAVFFLFSPVKNAWCRLFILPFLILLHFSFVLFLVIGIFPMVCITGVIVFLPGMFWDKVLPRFNRRPKRRHITLYYDEDCSFCRKTCLIFRELGLSPETRILPAQTVPDIHTIMQRENSWVVEDGNGVRRTRWEAAAWCWRRSPILWPLGVLFLPPFMRPLGDAIYHFIATHRGRFGTLSAKFLPESETDPAFTPYSLTQYVLAALTAFVVLWNVTTLPDHDFRDWPKRLDNTLNALSLRQVMNFFAPYPYQYSRWVAAEGYLEDGRVVDLMRNQFTPPSHAQPHDGVSAYPDHYWYKFYSRINFKHWHPILGRFYCRQWNETHPGLPLKRMVITIYDRRITGAGEKPELPKVTTTLRYDCKSADTRQR